MMNNNREGNPYSTTWHPGGLKCFVVVALYFCYTWNSLPYSCSLVILYTLHNWLLNGQQFNSQPSFLPLPLPKNTKQVKQLIIKQVTKHVTKQKSYKMGNNKATHHWQWQVTATIVFTLLSSFAISSPSSFAFSLPSLLDSSCTLHLSFHWYALLLPPPKMLQWYQRQQRQHTIED